VNILITGASGFVGTYLIRHMEGVQNINITLLVRTLPQYLNKWKTKFNVIQCDILNYECLKHNVSSDIDAIIHIAAYNDVDTEADPLQALKVNTFGTRNILNLSMELGIEHVVYFSVLQVYGRELEGNYTTDSPVLCDNDYSLNHYAAEEYCRMYSTNYNISTSIIRLGYSFGCPIDIGIDRWSLVPESFCMSAYNSGKIILKSSGKISRDFIPLNYVSESIEYLLKSPNTGCTIYNLVTETTMTILEVAELVKKTGERVLNKRIDLVVESDTPIIQNDFLVKNNILGPLRKESVEKSMEIEVEKIFIMLNKGV